MFTANLMVASLLTGLSLAGCGQRAKHINESSTNLKDVTANLVPPPASLRPNNLPPGAKFKLKDRGPLVIPGATTYFRLAYPDIYHLAAGSTVPASALICTFEFEQAFFERTLPASMELSLRSVETGDEEADALQIFNVQGSSDDFAFERFGCSIVNDIPYPPNGFDADEAVNAYNIYLPNLSQLSCLFDISIVVPPGRSNPPLTCNL